MSGRQRRAERNLAFGVAMRLLGNRDDADDAAQDAMLVACRHRASFRGDAELSEVAQVGRRVAEMSAISGTVLRMALAEGYTSTEVGRKLGMRPSTVMTQVTRGRAALRAILADAR